jgi:hypothetical protein
MLCWPDRSVFFFLSIKMDPAAAMRLILSKNITNSSIFEKECMKNNVNRIKKQNTKTPLTGT